MPFIIQSGGKGWLGAVLQGSVLTLALFLLYTGLPVVGLPAGILLPFPCMFYSIKFGRQSGYAIVGLVLLSLAVLDRAGMMLYLLQCVPCSLLLPEFLLRGKKSSRSILYSVAVSGGIIALVALISITVINGDIDAEIGTALNSSLKQVSKLYRQGGISGDDLKVLELALGNTRELVQKYYPALCIILLGTGAGLNLLLLRRFSGSLGTGLNLGSFSSYKNSDFLVWLIILPGFALLIENALVDRIAMNIMAVTVYLYLVQGSAILAWYIRKLRIPRFFAMLFFVLLLITPILAAAVAAFGLIDLWADFRAPNKNHKPVESG